MFLIKNAIAFQLLFHVLCNCFKIPIKFCIRMVQMLLFGMTWYLEINFSYIYVRQKVLAESIEIPFKCIEWNAYTIDVSVFFLGRASNQTTKLSICVTTFGDVYRKTNWLLCFSSSASIGWNLDKVFHLTSERYLLQAQHWIVAAAENVMGKHHIK